MAVTQVLGWVIAITASLGEGCSSPAALAATNDQPGDANTTSFHAHTANDLDRIVLRGLGLAIDPQHVDPSIPSPQQIIGHHMGDGAVRYEPMIRYLQALADASPYVTLDTYATTHEGRPLHYLTICSPEHRRRLDEIRRDNDKVFDPRSLRQSDDPTAIINRLPAIAWMAYSIHGDELSPTDAAMLLAHRLAAGNDELARRMRDEMIIFIDPLQNPDGRERYLAQLQTLQGKVLSHDFASMQHSGLWSAGRGNHYLFDLNRDWLTHVHPETRGRVELIRQWRPHLLVDAHEMSGLNTYLFDPPREPINPQLTEAALSWRTRVSDDQAAAFDAHGWSYYTGEWYEEWGPYYTNAWATLIGSVGILYEQGGVNAAAVKQATGEIVTYADAVHRQYVSSMANLKTMLENKNAFLRDMLADRRRDVVRRADDPVFVVPPSDNRSLIADFLQLMDRQGIEYTRSDAPLRVTAARGITGDTHDTLSVPAGAIIIRTNQPHKRLLHSILDFDPRMTDAFLAEERTEVENGRGGFVYDVTAWNVPMSYGLQSYWAASVEAIRRDDDVLAPFEQPMADPFADPPSYGYLIDVNDHNVGRLLVRLFEQDCQVRVASKPIEIAGRTFDAGVMLLRKHENPDDLTERLRLASDGLGLDIVPVNTARTINGWDLGGERFPLLTAPRVAIVSQWPVSTTSFGAVWYLVDAELGMRCSPINGQSLGGMDLRKYNVLIVPSGSIGAILRGGAAERIKTWVRQGGTLIAIEGAASTLADAEFGLSSTRRLRDVLDERDVYAEFVARERAARDISIDPEVVWDGVARKENPDDSKATRTDSDVGETDAAATARDGSSATDDKPLVGEAAQRLDAWRQRFSPSGVMLRADANPEHWLCYGHDGSLPALMTGSSVLMSKPPVQTAVRFSPYESLRLGGLLWPEARHRIADSAYATVERVGNGQVILFAADPYFRGNMKGTGRLLINAILLGPGLGTNQPLPW